MSRNHHAVYCAPTEVNGTALATGSYPEHSGIIANSDYMPEIDPLKPLDTQSVPVIRKGDQLTGGHYLLRPTLAEILQRAGKRTAISGAKAVVVLHDRRERPENATNIVVFEGRTLPPSALPSIERVLGKFPTNVATGSSIPNEPRNLWTRRALTDVLWSNGVPAFSLLWLNEPDFSQHAQGPGSPKALAALASNDRRLGEVLTELEKRGVREQTDVFVVSDHGFSTVDRSVDVSRVLRNAGFPVSRAFRAPPKTGDILIDGQSGSVLFFVIGHDVATTRKLVEFLQQQEFAGAIFTRVPVDGAFALDLAKINSPRAADVVMSMHWSSNARRPGAPGVFVSEGTSRAGQGNHASLGPSDMHNILVGSGPDLKKRFQDDLPTGNTDLAPTILWLLGVKPDEAMDGRVMAEALTVDGPPVGPATTTRLEAQRSHAHSVWRQYLEFSQVNQTIYLDEANGGATAK